MPWPIRVSQQQPTKAHFQLGPIARPTGETKYTKRHSLPSCNRPRMARIGPVRRKACLRSCCDPRPSLACMKLTHESSISFLFFSCKGRHACVSLLPKFVGFATVQAMCFHAGDCSSHVFSAVEARLASDASRAATTVMDSMHNRLPGRLENAPARPRAPRASDHWSETCGHSIYPASCFCSRFLHSNSTTLPTVSSQARNCSYPSAPTARSCKFQTMQTMFFTSSPTLEAPMCACMNDLLTRQVLRPSCPSMLPCTPRELHFCCL